MTNAQNLQHSVKNSVRLAHYVKRKPLDSKHSRLGVARKHLKRDEMSSTRPYAHLETEARAAARRQFLVEIFVGDHVTTYDKLPSHQLQHLASDQAAQLKRISSKQIPHTLEPWPT